MEKYFLKTQNSKHRSDAGFSILEIVVACSIILVSVFSLMSLAQKSVQFSRLSLNQTQASFLLEEGAEAVKSMRDSGWTNISSLTTGLTYYLVWSSGAWGLQQTNDTPTGQFTRTVVVNDVYRSDDTQDVIPPVASALDNVPPAIVLAPTASQVASNHAQIHWRTNERGNSQVRYGTTSHANNGKGSSPLAFLRSVPAVLSAAAGNALSVWNASDAGQLHANKLAIAGTYEFSTAIDSTLTTDHTVTLSSLVPNTTYYYRTYSQDAAGNSGISAEQAFVTAPAPDTVAPTVSVTSPTNGSAISGTVTLSASATDDVGVDHVDFYISSLLIQGDSTAPYSISLNTAGYANGTFPLKAVAYDAAGNSTISTVNVTINNYYYPPYVPPPSDTTSPTASLTAPGSGTLTGTLAVSATASDDRSVDHVDFYSGSTLIGADATAPYSINWDSSTLANGTYTLTARAFDQTGNYGNSTGVSVTLNNPVPPGDTTAPVVVLTSPGNGSTLTGQMTFSATASDNIGVTRVEFYYNYAMFDQDTTATNGNQYSVLWWTQSVSNGYYTISAKAYDAAGNFSISSITVSISNSSYYYCPGDCTPPDFVYLYAPMDSSTVTGIVPLSVNARDNVGVAYVDFYYNGTFIDRDTTSDGADNFTVNWDTTYIVNNMYGLWANVYDASGNGTTTGLSVYVNTSNTPPDPKSGGDGKLGPLDPTTYTMINTIINSGAPVDSKIEERLQNILNMNFQINDTARLTLRDIIDYGVPLSETNKTIFNSVLGGTPLSKEVYSALQNMVKTGIYLDVTTQQTLQTVIDTGQIDDLTRETLQYMIDTGAPLATTTRDTLWCILSISDGNPKCSSAPTTELYSRNGVKILMSTHSSVLARVLDYVRSYISTPAQATGTQTLDPGTKLITITVSWTDSTGIPTNKALSFYLANIF